MNKIMNAYHDVDRKPVIETTKNAFKIILPNINSKPQVEEFHYDYSNQYLNRRE